MKHHFIIDTSVYLTYDRHNKLYRIAYCVLDYGLQMFTNAHLFNELKRNLPKASYNTDIDVQAALNLLWEIRWTDARV